MILLEAMAATQSRYLIGNLMAYLPNTIRLSHLTLRQRVRLAFEGTWFESHAVTDYPDYFSFVVFLYLSRKIRVSANVFSHFTSDLTNIIGQSILLQKFPCVTFREHASVLLEGLLASA
jgi:hypothetical protein